MSAVPRRTALAVAAALSFAALAGCAGRQDSPTAASPGQSPTTTNPTETATTPAAPITTAVPTQTPTSFADRLLPTAAVPGLNPTWHWQDGTTGTAPTTPFGTCARVDLASIGATKVVQRSYFPPVDTDDHADEQIAEFPDPATAARAAQVLESWRSRCAARVTDGTAVHLGSRTPVPTGTGTGSWYLLSWHPNDAEENRYEAVGTVVSGTRIAVLLIVSGAQKYVYPAGGAPMDAMVVAAASRLG